MSESNKSYRIKTNVGSEYNGDLKLNVNLLQDYDEFEILSLKIGTENLYKYHTSHYGCVVGRVLANGGVGVPNVKISSFIPVEDIDIDDPVFSFLYPYSSTIDKNRDNIRYNLLTDTKIDDCHQPVGTFPNKRLVLDDNNVIEIYDKYYKFTTTTNGSGDYMLFGLPVGNNIIHSDLDISDIGVLSQKPRDLFYKGYTAKQFENASQFKKDTNLDNLTQVISQDSSVYVFPFWGDETENEGQIKIVRNDIDVNYKFEPTCIFIGCIVSDEKSNAISKNCIPHERMGKMDRLTTGAGTIEMIRKTVAGDIESIAIQGNELIDGNGTWCYQIPMNLDYVATDEYGNLVPTDNYKKGLPTRTSVRFRISLADYESDYENAHLVKVLVPNNPEMKTFKTSNSYDFSNTSIISNNPELKGDFSQRNKSANSKRKVAVNNKGFNTGIASEIASVNYNYIDYDYEFGSATKDESFRDMFWNNVYTVKSYIPRFQKGNRQRNKNFTGFKAVNANGANNPIPYNNMRINLTFLFVFQCLIFKSLVLIVKTLNKIITVLNRLNCNANKCCGTTFACEGDEGLVYLTLDGGMCPALEGNFIAPGAGDENRNDIITHTYKNVYGEEYDVKFKIEAGGDDVTYTDPPEGKFITEGGTATPYDEKSSDFKNSDLIKEGSFDGEINKEYTPDDVKQGSEDETENIKIYNQERYFVKCVELNFAMEYEVIQFDFYNDWINGMIYIPRWFAEIKKNKDNAYYCGSMFMQNRMLTQQCAIAYDDSTMIDSNFNVGCRNNKQQCHKRWGRKQVKIFGKNKGIVTAQKNSRGQYAYYLKPSELVNRESSPVKANLFPTDIVLLGSVLDCNQYGIPKVKGYTSSSYKMPPPTAEIVSDTQEMMLDREIIDNIHCASVRQAVKSGNSAINTLITNILNKTFLVTKYDCNTSDLNDQESFSYKIKIFNEAYIFNFPREATFGDNGSSVCGKFDFTYGQNCSSFNMLSKNTEKLNKLINIVNTNHPGTGNDIENVEIKISEIVDFIKSLAPSGHAYFDDNFDLYNKLSFNNDDIYDLCSDSAWTSTTVGSSKFYCLIRNKAIELLENIYRLIKPYSPDYQASCVYDGDYFLLVEVLMKYIMSSFGYDYRKKLAIMIWEEYNTIYDKLSLKYSDDPNAISFYSFEKKLIYDAQFDLLDLEGGEEYTYSELSGIDWGYNPFDTGDDDDTTSIEKQVAGHFLEIGCTFSLTNIKSCVNLQRVCEIGSEISQSHYYYNKNSISNNKWDILDPTGIIAKREISDAGIRTTFATLNSQRLNIIPDPSNGYKKYNFTPYNPVSFMGDLTNRSEITALENTNGSRYKTYDLIENQSLSYRAFRFGTIKDNVDNKFLIKEKVNNKNLYYMPQYENSFYFYFGLKDGNTAIDRLYSEYYASCDTNKDDASVEFSVEPKTSNGNRYFEIHYSTQNIGKIKSVSIILGGRKLLLDEDFTWDKKNSVIKVTEEGKYVIKVKDINNLIVRSSVDCKYNNSVMG